MPKRYDVYLSSTRADLEAERKLVAEIINGEHKWVLNESYSASHRPTLESCLKDVEDSRVYLCVVGARYGGIAATGAPDDPKWSYTQHEFEHATKLGIPRFVFFKEGGFGLADVDADRTAIDAFRSRVTGSGGVRPAQFKTEGELRSALSKSRDAMRTLLDADNAASTPAGRAGATASRPWVTVTDQTLAQLSASPAPRWLEIRAGIERLMALAPLSALATLWNDEVAPTVQDDGGPAAAAAINRWTRTLEALAATDPLPPVAGRSEATTAVMKLLFALAPAEAAWQPGAWQTPEGAVHFECAQLMAAVRSVTLGRNFDLALGQLDNGAAQLATDWLQDLNDGPEFGVGADLARHMQDQVARRFAYPARQARTNEGKLHPQDVRRLASFVRNRQDIERRVYVVSEEVGNGQSPNAQLRAAVEELGAHAIPRCCQPTHLLRDDEFDLEDAVCQCLTAIGKLP